MTSIPNRTNSALLVIDVQNSVVADAYERDQIVANINTAVVKARAAGVPVIWIQHSDEWMAIGSEDWKIVPELVPVEGEPLVGKLYRNSFEATNLEEELSKLGVGHLYITGAQTNNCVRFTSHGALDRGYDITLIEDAHTTSDYQWNSGPVKASVLINDLNASMNEMELPGRVSKIAPVTELFN
jgi:nicotinamidase-related amidase